MTHGLLMLHIAAIAFWIGVVGAEFVIERSRAASKPHGYAVAHNHFWIDMLLEVPAVLTVLVTGALLLPGTSLTPLLAVKVGAGLLAAASNLACVVPVTLRRRAAREEALPAVIRHSRTIDHLSALGLPAAALALVLGLLPGR